MPAAVKNSEHMTKHLTKAELDARLRAEEEVLPQRQRVKLKKPGFLSGNRQANAYWNQILKRMEGLALLDDLDSEMLAGYCSMLARRDQTILLVSQLMDRLGVAGAVDKKNPPGEDSGPPMTPDALIEAASKLDALTGKLQALERNLLQYAEKLGLTPSGRARLAQKRAQAAAPDPDSDLFGD